MSIFLSELIGSYPCSRCGSAEDPWLTSLEYDSREAMDAHTLFFCLPGARSDGHTYAPQVYQAGCRSFVAEHPLALPEDAVQIIVPSSRETLADFSARFYGNPADKLKLIGLTGTKGKTTTAIMISEILTACGIPCAYIGSNGVQIGEKHYATVNTTPESRELQRFFAEMVQSGITHVAMEVSSQALDHARVRGLTFDIVVYTNLSPDHIGEGEHASFEEYRDAKRKLFTDYGAKTIVYNADDSHAAYMINGCQAKRVRYAMETEAEFKASSFHPYRDRTSLGVDFDLEHAGVKTGFRLRTPGQFSVYNGLAAAAVAMQYGLGLRTISDALRNISIRGRFEMVDALDGITFIIDYAHNGYSLSHALQVLRSYRPKRLICLFGCIGGRTYGRRKELAETASAMADFTILSSDNPDNEDPETILADVLSYFDTSKLYTVIPDREEAVRFAVRMADEGDIVLFAGKGHEDYQIIDGKKVPFSEKNILLDEASRVKTERISLLL